MSIDAPGLEEVRIAHGLEPSRHPLLSPLVDARRRLHGQGFVGSLLILDVPKLVEGALLKLHRFRRRLWGGASAQSAPVGSLRGSTRRPISRDRHGHRAAEPNPGVGTEHLGQSVLNKHPLTGRFHPVVAAPGSVRQSSRQRLWASRIVNG